MAKWGQKWTVHPEKPTNINFFELWFLNHVKVFTDLQITNFLFCFCFYCYMTARLGISGSNHINNSCIQLIDQKHKTVRKQNSWTNNMKIQQFVVLIIIFVPCSISGKTISGVNIQVHLPYKQVSTDLKMSRCPHCSIMGQGRKQIVLQNKKRKDRLTIENSAYIRSPDKHIYRPKRSFGCLRQCLRVGNIHPAQCHSLCFY